MADAKLNARQIYPATELRYTTASMYAAMTRNQRLKFTLEAQCPWSGARATRFETAHRVVETPIFMPVATHAALRGVDMAVTHQMGYQVLLANTYHLLLRPGPKVFEQFGGIHTFMQWPNAVLTDSGGFQIFSLSRQLQMSEEGARFRSYVDGSEVVLTPEVSIATQRSIGSDIMMVLDQCIDSTSDEATTRLALELTTRWAKRSLEARGDSSQALFGIVQGACFPALRRESAAQITSLPFDGFALGGLAVGETKSQREDIVEMAAPLLPHDRPRYLMGVGTPIDLLEAVKRGMDMFDCIIPTSYAHQGVCFTSGGKLDLGRGAFKHSEERLDAKCDCSTCARFSRAYLSHLVRAGEFIVGQLLSVHNLAFYRTLMREMRRSIIDGRFKEFYLTQREQLMARDAEFPEVQPRRTRKNKDILGDYEIVAHPSGYGSIRQLSSGEVMHSVVNPADEALSLYVRQPGIPELATQEGAPISIWDVGLGAATNAMTCIQALEAIGERKRSVEIHSFERDLDPLRLALKRPALFKHLRHAAPHRLLEAGSWAHREGTLTWTLYHGDFHARLSEASPPDLIWYDPFSFKVDSALWSVEAFSLLLQSCASRASRLFTYTASTAVRAAMLAAGWYVGAGVGTGPKKETTVAYSPKAAEALLAGALLGQSWLTRWQNSDAQMPFGGKDESICELVRGHPQFRS
ncbi:MAG: tRNA guanosine(34) transglycosylase Tgt [Proteobacteria bacterium]|nr:tRNA guanosine(34) transglycosylase Tgt [Pseudomonadota bacterium]